MIRTLWLTFLAHFHWSDAAVCAMSQGERDYHDDRDAEGEDRPRFGPQKCRRCGKTYYPHLKW